MVKSALGEFKKGIKTAIISDVTRMELFMAPSEVMAILDAIPRENIVDVALNEEAEVLASEYVKNGAVTKRHVVDAQHIAIATVVRADVLVSWNFRQIVNLIK